MTYNVLIIEDEIPASQRLAKMIADLAPDMHIMQCCDSVESGINFLKSHTPDLIFLDIQLGDGISFEIFEATKINCPVIFATAYDEFVFRAFELNSIDYLLKPIEKEKLARSIEKFKNLQFPHTTDWRFLKNIFIDENSGNYKQRFLVHVGSSLVSVPTRDIAYFYSAEKITFFISTSGKTYTLEHSLDKLSTMLSPNDFFRINRQYLVSLQSIKKIHVLSKSRIKLILNPESEKEVFVSNQKAHDFRVWLDR